MNNRERESASCADLDFKGVTLSEEEEFRANKTYAVEAEDLIAERLLYAMLRKPVDETGTYVDIGAHDPIRASNTYRLYKRGWRGLNIEPNPDAIPRFLEIRPRDITVNMGVAEKRGSLTYSKFSEPMLNGFFEDKWVERHVQMKTAELISREQVPVAPAREIISQHLGQTAVDMLNIDVELLEMQVLRSLDFATFRPKIIVIELHGPLHDLDTTKPIPTFDAETIGRTREAKLLKAAGYAFFSRIWHSSIFVEGSAIASTPRRWWRRV